jgi:hypothetical protein
METTTLVLVAGAAIWVGVIAWAAARWKRNQEARERERSMRYEQLIGPALVAAAGPGARTPGVSVAGSAPSALAAPQPATGTVAGAAAGLSGPASGAGAPIDPVRLAEAMMAAQGAAMARTAAGTGRATSARTSAGLMPDAAILRAPPFRMRDRLLDKAATLALYAIRAAVPDHEVFVRVSLAELFEVPESAHAYDRAQRLKKLAPFTVDFAVATKAMQLVAVIDLEDAHATAEQRELQKAKAEYLRAFPVRHLTFSRAQLPKYQDIRQLLQSTT